MVISQHNGRFTAEWSISENLYWLQSRAELFKLLRQTAAFDVLHLMCVFYLDVGALKAHTGISALLLCKLANTRAVDMVQVIFRSGIAGYLTNT